MPQLTVRLSDRNGALTTELDRRIKQLLDAEDKALRTAARTATDATRSHVRYRRQVIAPRPGRSSTGGHMKDHLSWTVRGGQVQFDMEKANREAEHWIIQEVGTGGRATIKRAAQPNPTGRPKKGASYVRTVKSQRGRRISGGLVFATGGVYSPPGARRDEQLHLASQVRGVPQWNPRGGRQAAAIRIRREIPAQHFVKKGGTQGFREYKQSVLGAARQAFRKGRRP